MRGFPFCDLLQGPRLAGTQNGVPDVGVGEWSFLCKRKGVVGVGSWCSLWERKHNDRADKTTENK